jgi:hypothetical protein
LKSTDIGSSVPKSVGQHGQRKFDLSSCLASLETHLGQQAQPKKSADIGVFEHWNSARESL